MAPSDRPGSILQVAVAVVQQDDGRVLLAERPPGKPWAGYWEFPGGKIETAESALQALTRELHEELGIEVDAAFPWLTYEHRYPQMAVRLHFFRVLAWHGTPQGREGQRVSWQNPAALQVGPLLPANARVLQSLGLPPVYAITNARRYGVTEFMARLERALDRGVRLLQVREPDMSAEQLAEFVRHVVGLAHARGARVLVNGDAAIAERAGADGMHLPARELMQLGAAPTAPLWAASCHDAAELARAAELGASFVVLSPVLPTPSHPGAPGMGWERFAQLVRDYPLPVYALGGMKRELLATAMRHGAHGVSLLSGIW